MFQSPSSGAHPTFYLMGTEVYFPGTSWAGREDKHSHLSIAEVKNEWSYSSTFSYAFVKCKIVSLYLYRLLFYLRIIPFLLSLFLSLFVSVFIFLLPTVFLFLWLPFFFLIIPVLSLFPSLLV